MNGRLSAQDAGAATFTYALDRLRCDEQCYATRSRRHMPLETLLADEIGHNILHKLGIEMSATKKEIGVTRLFENLYRAYRELAPRCGCWRKGDLC